ncbi:MAG: glycosyltransferase family 92 protein [Parachlamydiaceae bacterium]|nr:glycosyltransferase family 92 protein [Parachlamydiaceae bacterium]
MPDTIYKYDFAICAIFQNEAPYLKEWIEYHKIVGAKHFYLYNNFSQDHYLTVLKPYISTGMVELIDWTEPDFQSYGQRMAYMDAIYKARGSAKWLAIIDIDEYLVPKANETIPELLSQFEKEGIGGVAINWQMFGTSYVPYINENQLLTEVLTLKAVEEHSENEHIKSIVRPEYVIEPPGIHNFNYRDGYFQVNTDHEAFTGAISPYIATDKMQINHYWAKDEAFFTSVKIPRRLNWGESMENIENRLNELNKVHDTSIDPYLPTLRQRMFFKAETVPLFEGNENLMSQINELSDDYLDFVNPDLMVLSEVKNSDTKDNIIDMWAPTSKSSLFSQVRSKEAHIPLNLVASNDFNPSFQETSQIILNEHKASAKWLAITEWSLLCCVVFVLIAAVRLWRLKAVSQ